MGGMEGKECQTCAVKTDPFYGLGNRDPEKSLVLGHKENQDREARPEPWAPDSPPTLFPQIPKALKSFTLCVQDSKR